MRQHKEGRKKEKKKKRRKEKEEEANGTQWTEFKYNGKRVLNSLLRACSIYYRSVSCSSFSSRRYYRSFYRFATVSKKKNKEEKEATEENGKEKNTVFTHYKQRSTRIIIIILRFLFVLRSMDSFRHGQCRVKH